LRLMDNCQGTAGNRNCRRSLEGTEGYLRNHWRREVLILLNRNMIVVLENSVGTFPDGQNVAEVRSASSPAFAVGEPGTVPRS
jgi:hypothetical protein